MYVHIHPLTAVPDLLECASELLVFGLTLIQTSKLNQISAKRHILLLCILSFPWQLAHQGGRSGVVCHFQTWPPKTAEDITEPGQAFAYLPFDT